MELKISNVFMLQGLQLVDLLYISTEPTSEFSFLSTFASFYPTFDATDNIFSDCG